MRNVTVRRVLLEESRLVCSRILHGPLSVDILLTPVHDADETELERIDTAGKDIQGIGAGVHEIELGENTDSAVPLRVDRARKLERVRVGKVDIRRRDR